MNAEFCFDDLFTLHISGFYFRYIYFFISHSVVLTGKYVFHCFKKSECLATRAFTVTISVQNIPIICHEDYDFIRIIEII